jgi:hypothetical protein
VRSYSADVVSVIPPDEGSLVQVRDTTPRAVVKSALRLWRCGVGIGLMTTARRAATTGSRINSATGGTRLATGSTPMSASCLNRPTANRSSRNWSTTLRRPDSRATTGSQILRQARGIRSDADRAGLPELQKKDFRNRDQYECDHQRASNERYARRLHTGDPTEGARVSTEPFVQRNPYGRTLPPLNWTMPAHATSGQWAIDGVVRCQVLVVPCAAVGRA